MELAGEDSGLVAGDRVFGCSFFGSYATRCSAKAACAPCAPGPALHHNAADTGKR